MGSQVGSRFSSKISAFRNCQKISVESFFGASSTEVNFFCFLGENSIVEFFRFNSAAKQTRNTLGSPQIVLTPRGVGNLRRKWYVDGTAYMEFIHGVPTIGLCDTGRSMTRNSTNFVMLLALTARLINPRFVVASPESLTSGHGYSAISYRLISILSRVFLKMISVELHLSTSILATSMSQIINSMTRRSLQGLSRSDVPNFWKTRCYCLLCHAYCPLIVWRFRVREFDTPSF